MEGPIGRAMEHATRYSLLRRCDFNYRKVGGEAGFLFIVRGRSGGGSWGGVRRGLSDITLGFCSWWEHVVVGWTNHTTHRTQGEGGVLGVEGGGCGGLTYVSAIFCCYGVWMGRGGVSCV